MGEKIEISDQRLARRVDAAVADLERFYPDKKVYSLNGLHKGLSNRVGELWPLIGYDSRDAFFAAYGFELVSRGLGRPVTFNPEELFSELAARYEGVEKPSSLGVLIYDNPDLKASLKTFQNKSLELFGETAVKVLRKRGILGHPGKTVGGITDDVIRSMLDALAAKYADASIKPSTMVELKADNPKYQVAIAAFYARGKMMYGMPPRRKLIELGIFPAPKTVAAIAVDDASVDEIESAIDELGEMLCDLPAESKPKTIDALVKAYPKQGGFISAGKKKGLLDKAFLQELGILAPTQVLIRKKGVRKVASEELLPLFVDAVGEIYIEPGDGYACYLPPYIVGIDAAQGVELREAIVSVKGDAAKAMAVGEKYTVVFTAFKYSPTEYSTVRILGEHSERIDGVRFAGIYDDAVKESASRLADFEGALVISVSEFKGQCVAQLRFRHLAILRSDTMAYVLRRRGIVTDADLMGGMGWRFRMRKAARGTFEVEKFPKALSDAPSAGTVEGIQFGETISSISAEGVRFGCSSKADLADLGEDGQTPHESGDDAYGYSDKAALSGSLESGRASGELGGLDDVNSKFNLGSTPQPVVHYGVSSK